MGEYINKKVLKAAWPIIFGYIPLGIACGILAQKVGFDVWQMLFMAVFLFAGSGQFISLAMIGAGSSILSVVLTVFIVNLRHLLYALILNQHLFQESKLYKAFFAQEIVDESFAVNQTQFSRKSENWTAKNALGVNMVGHSSWIVANVLGLLLGASIYIDTSLVNYILIAMFIGLWSFHFSDYRMVVTGIFGGVLALVLSLWLDNMLYVVVATVLVAAMAAFIWPLSDKDKKAVHKKNGINDSGGAEDAVAAENSAGKEAQP